MSRIKFLDCPLDILSLEETVKKIDVSISNKKLVQQVVVNVAKLILMRSDPKLKASVVQSDIINVDGMGIVYGARFLGYDVPERVTGIDLFEKLLDLSEQRGYGVYLLGATPEVLTQARNNITKQREKIVISGEHHGYFWEDEQTVVKKIKQSGAQLLFVAISSPKKEIFINKWKDELGVYFIMGVGGSFDVFAGKISRAPQWMQKNGLEWFYRFINEPRRMWKRYLLTNTYYALLLLYEKLIKSKES
jgi:N-acetylglucosaminyldiphosphoundecaprenol N-acetyl-beta-D-mannosaminyltransferase